VRREIKSSIAGSVWSHAAFVGQRVEAGATIVILESMKCEIPLETPVTGTITWLKPCAEEVAIDDVVAELDVA
jgi:acetyl-CoA carboxylase biotin carboxyl carrier protein